MKAILRREREQFFTGKILFLIFGCVLFSLSARQSTSLSYMQFVLHMLSEHYYITYFMIPVFLLVIYKSFDDEVEYILIRSRYYWKYFWTKALALFLNIVGFVFVQIVTIMLVSIGLSTEQSFATSNPYMLEIFQAYAEYFRTPLTAIIAASGYMIIGLTVMSVLFLTVHHFFSKKTVSIVMITLYVLITFGLKIPGLNDIPFLFMNNYILLFYNLSSKNGLIISLLSMMFILIVAMILVKFYWKKQSNLQFELKVKGIAFYYARYLFTKKNVLILIAIVSFISVWKLFNVSSFSETTAKDFFMSLFYGHGVNEFYMIAFLEMLILNGVPLYLFAIFMEGIHRAESVGLMIRLKTKKSLVKAILRISTIFIVMYIGLLLGIGLILVVSQGLSMDGITRLVAGASMLKFLDIIFQFLLFITLFIWKRNVTMAFLMVLSTNVISLLPISWVIYFPTGLSSLARNRTVIGDRGISFIVSALIMVGFSCGLWTYIKYKGYQKVLGG